MSKDDKLKLESEALARLFFADACSLRASLVEELTPSSAAGFLRCGLEKFSSSADKAVCVMLTRFLCLCEMGQEDELAAETAVRALQEQNKTASMPVPTPTPTPAPAPGPKPRTADQGSKGQAKAAQASQSPVESSGDSPSTLNLLHDSHWKFSWTEFFKSHPREALRVAVTQYRKSGSQRWFGIASSLAHNSQDRLLLKTCQVELTLPGAFTFFSKERVQQFVAWLS